MPMAVNHRDYVQVPYRAILSILAKEAASSALNPSWHVTHTPTVSIASARLLAASPFQEDMFYKRAVVHATARSAARFQALQRPSGDFTKGGDSAAAGYVMPWVIHSSSMLQPAAPFAPPARTQAVDDNGTAKARRRQTENWRVRPGCEESLYSADAHAATRLAASRYPRYSLTVVSTRLSNFLLTSPSLPPSPPPSPPPPAPSTSMSLCVCLCLLLQLSRPVA
jgi:hypothetical protein